MWFPLGVVAIDPKLVVGLRQQSANSCPLAETGLMRGCRGHAGQTEPVKLCVSRPTERRSLSATRPAWVRVQRVGTGSKRSPTRPLLSIRASQLSDGGAPAFYWRAAWLRDQALRHWACIEGPQSPDWHRKRWASAPHWQCLSCSISTLIDHNATRITEDDAGLSVWPL